MTQIELGDELCVVVWRAGYGTSAPRAYPLAEPIDLDRRLEVIDGRVDTIATVRVCEISAEVIRSRVISYPDPKSTEAKQSRTKLAADFDLPTEVIEQEEQKRVIILASRDYHHQWLEQKRRTFEKVPDHQ